MAESNELQSLDIMKKEVDEAHKNVILTTQCIKAQEILIEKLKREAKRKKEIIGLMSNANLKLKFEITQAEQEIKSSQIATETVKRASVELKKELLLTKYNKLEIIERAQSGEKKYEELWLECKSRFERLPHVQKLMKADAKAEHLNEQITTLDKQAETLRKEIKAKTEACRITDRERIIQLAHFMVHERPKLINRINENSKAITHITNDLKTFGINSVAETNDVVKEKIVDERSKMIDNDQNIHEHDLNLPKLQLSSFSSDLDELTTFKLDQAKQVNYTARMEKKKTFSNSYADIGTPIFNKETDIGEGLLSSYFFKPTARNEENKSKNYSKRKLINILEDVQIDGNDAMNMISKANIDTLKPVESISVEGKSLVSEDTGVGVSRNEVTEPMQIEETDMTSTNEDNIVNPPTQFLDASLNTQKSQKVKNVKKTVSFDWPSTPQSDAISDTNKSDVPKDDTNKTINSQVVSAGDDDGFTKMKDMVLKEHNLDVSPPFVYAKKTMLQKTEEKDVTSKFFKNNKDVDETGDKREIQPVEIENKTTQDNPSKKIDLDVDDNVMVSSLKEQNASNFMDEMSTPLKPFSGYLFEHGTQELPESLDISIRTTGFEDMDIDFPHCIDSSLLLSPKADFPPCSDNSAVQSQDAPNFLSGLRKTGSSFFGRLSAGDSKPDSNAPSQGSSGFNFNFNSEEKKNRGGIFNMFQ